MEAFATRSLNSAMVANVPRNGPPESIAPVTPIPPSSGSQALATLQPMRRSKRRVNRKSTPLRHLSVTTRRSKTGWLVGAASAGSHIRHDVALTLRPCTSPRKSGFSGFHRPPRAPLRPPRPRRTASIRRHPWPLSPVIVLFFLFDFFRLPRYGIR